MKYAGSYPSRTPHTPRQTTSGRRGVDAIASPIGLRGAGTRVLPGRRDDGDGVAGIDRSHGSREERAASGAGAHEDAPQPRPGIAVRDAWAPEHFIKTPRRGRGRALLAVAAIGVAAAALISAFVASGDRRGARPL